MFLLFAGADYYASGGWDDIIRSFDTLEEAEDAVKNNKNYPIYYSKWDIYGRSYDWYHVVDLDQGVIVVSG